MDLKESFINLKALLTRKLSQNVLDVERFRWYINDLFSVSSPNTNIISTIIESVGEQKLWDYSNTEHIECIAVRYLRNDKEVWSTIDNHKLMVNKYNTTKRIADYIEEKLTTEFKDVTKHDPHCRRNSQKYYDTLSLKLDDVRVGRQTLKYVRDLWNNLRGQFRLPECNALLDSIYYGSVVIVWLIPSSVSPEMKRPQPWSAIHFLQEMLISRMVLNNSYCIYDTKVSWVCNIYIYSMPLTIT